MDDYIVLEETERSTARRVYRVRVLRAHVLALVAQRLSEISKNVRLPGFRPGKVPARMIAQRYGDKARSEAIQRIGAEAADSVLARGELAASLELSEDSAEAVEFRLAVTHLAELVPLDFAAIRLERLSAPQSALEQLGMTEESAGGLLENHLHKAVLDTLDQTYRFPLAPQVVARELALVRRAAAEALACASTVAELEAMEAQLGAIAERRVRLGAVVTEMARRYEIVLVEEELQRERYRRESPAQTRDRLLEDKLIRFIVSKAQVIDREATVDELRDLAAE